jgi:hypothetical protein
MLITALECFADGMDERKNTFFSPQEEEEENPPKSYHSRLAAFFTYQLP